MNSFVGVVAHHPFLVLTAVAVFSGTCIIIPFAILRLPNFKDPQLGFETRGTTIAQRLTAWKNLLEATRQSGPLTVHPPTAPPDLFKGAKKYDSSEKGAVYGIKTVEPTGNNKTSSFNELVSTMKQMQGGSGGGGMANLTKLVGGGGRQRNQSYDADDEDEDEDWESLLNLDSDDHDHHDHHEHLSPDRFFCNQPAIDYGRVVMSSTDDSDLFNLESIYNMCLLEAALVMPREYSTICETVSRGRCCRPWSLPNYIAMLNNRSSCLNVTKEDVQNVKDLLDYCKHYYFNQRVTEYSLKNIPAKCHKYNAVFNLMHFTLDYNFQNSTTPLKNVIVMLPIARSSSAFDYYHALDLSKLELENVAVTGVDFGLKNTVFDKYLVRDTRLIGLGAAAVLWSIWAYTKSLFITIMCIIAICFSLGISYFLYTLIFELQFFPFMNLLAVIVAVGVGGDAGLLVCKVWSSHKSEAPQSNVSNLVNKCLKHSFMCMLVSSLTTAGALYASFVSDITAICCFSIFAGTAVLANFGVMIAWLPSCLSIVERFKWPLRAPEEGHLEQHWWQRFRPTLPSLSVGPVLRPLLITSVFRLRYIWIAVLGSLGILGAFLTLCTPRLRLPDTPDLQLFTSNHPFEKYDLVYRNMFRFERFHKYDMWDNPNAHLPMRFVWGVLPVDNGNYLDPSSRGTVELDPTFDLADPESQVWLKNFCTRLKGQPFYQSTMGPLLPNCFLEVFVDWMERKCADPVSNRSRAPCCESAKFPYSRRVFSTCFPRAAASLYSTPARFQGPGPAGPKFSRPHSPGMGKASQVPKLQALVVEYDSNYTHTTSYFEMDQFFKTVESWMEEELKTAPAGMKNGWFISHLELYDLQHSLAEDTVKGIAVSMVISFLFIFAATFNIVLSFLAVITISSIIFVTTGVLVLLGWRLNVLEAVTVGVAIGLSVDFTIHYIINYKESGDKDKRESRVGYALSMMGGPTLMSALTTVAAGVVMLPSSVLAYRQIGVFLIVLMTTSWLYSSLFLSSLLVVFGPTEFRSGRGRGPRWRRRQSAEPDPGGTELGALRSVMLEDSQPPPDPEPETETSAPGSTGTRRKGLAHPRNTRTAATEQSPSAASATTIIHDDDVEPVVHVFPA